MFLVKKVVVVIVLLVVVFVLVLLSLFFRVETGVLFMTRFLLW